MLGNKRREDMRVELKKMCHVAQGSVCCVVNNERIGGGGGGHIR